MPKRILVFVVPFLIWIFLLRDFLSGAIPLNLDTNTIYAVAKYYFNNLLNGVVPLWEPFVGIGRPFYAISICNLFNPVTQIIVVLKLLGVNYNIAFNVYMALYFWAGCFGFYLLVKRLLNDRTIAYLGYLCLMFSSLGVSLFTQLTFVEIVVPVIWFFYFLLSFAQAQSKGNFLGLSLSIMIILSSYLPFYFMTVFAVAGFLFFIVYFKETITFIKNIAVFKWKHRWLTLLCFIGIIISTGPLLAYKILDAAGDAVSPGRHCQYSSAQECYDRTMNHKGGMLYQEIARSGGLGERFDLGYLFTHLDKMTYGSDSLFFVSVFVYILLGLSLFLSLNRMTLFLVLLMAATGLIALGESSFLHKFLYDHVFFFGYFRNLFFLGAFLIPIVILLALKQLQDLLKIQPRELSHKKGMVVGIILLHAVCFMFLRRYDALLPITWITLGSSAVFFAVYYAGFYKWGMRIWAGLFAVLVLIQPIVTISAYSANAGEFKCVLPCSHVTPVFAWARPDKPAVSNCRIYQFVPYEDFWYAMSMTDAPAKLGIPQAAARWTFDVSQRLGDDALSAYAKYKVYLYDDLNQPGHPVTGPSANLDVAHFDVNRVVFKTHFEKPQILVYNDSFTQHWHTFIDGKKQEILRVNGAFKGVHVPMGEHLIEFRYQPPGGQWIYLLTALALMVFLMLTVKEFLIRKAR